MVIVRFVFILLLCFVLIVNPTKINENEEYAPHILAVLKYLNSNPNKVYDYNKGLFVNAQQKADIVELTIDVNVSCRPNYLEVPCTEQLLTCSGFLQQNVDEYDFKVLSNVACKPKRDSSIENLDELSSLSTPFQQKSEIELSHEAVSTEGNADFVAVKADTVPCVGCPFDLNTNADGVSMLVNTALRHIETERVAKHALVKIVKLQQQVVAGVKYILVIEIAPTLCQKDTAYSTCPLDTDAVSSICEVIFLQKPWISKSKSIISNNCTISQEYNINEETHNEENGMENKIAESFDTNRNAEVITEDNSFDSINPQGLADLESQILNVEPENSKATSKINVDKEIRPISANIAYQDGTSIPVRDFLSSSYKIQEPVTSDNNYIPLPFHFSEVHYEETLPAKVKTSSDVLLTDQPDKLFTNQVESDFLHLTTNRNWLEADDSVISETINYPKNDFPEEVITENISNRYEEELENINTHSSESLPNDSKTKSSELKLPENNVEKNDFSSTSQSNSSESNEDSKNNSSEENKSSRNSSNSKNDDSKSISSEESKILGRNLEKTLDIPVDATRSFSEIKNEAQTSSLERNKVKRTRSNNGDDSSFLSSGNTSSSKNKSHKKKQESDTDESNSSSSNSNSVDAERNKVKRSIAQLEKITQDEKLLVRDLADFAASTLDNIDDDNHKRVILQILGAKKLKLDGIYYQIILRLGISQCLENQENEDCGKKLLTNLTKICKVQVHVEDDFSNPQVIKSQCQNSKKDEHDRNRTNYSRYRREVLLGEASEMSFDDPKILEFTEDALTELDSNSDLPNRHKILNIVSATSQVVSGKKYHIKAQISLSDCLKNNSELLENCDFVPNAKFKLCDIVVWDQSWLKKKHTTVKCDDNDKEYSFDYTTRSKKSLLIDGKSKDKQNDMILGGIEKESSDKLKALEYIKSILNHLDMESGHNNKLKVQEILTIKKEAVAGEMWRIKAEVVLSECLKSESVDPQKCKTLKGSDSHVCIFRVWNRPWPSNSSEVKTICEDDSKSLKFRLKRNVGVPKYIIPRSSNVSTKDDEVSSKILEYVKIGLNYLDLKSIYETKYVVKKINEIIKQAGSDQVWQITAEIALSDCPKHYYTQYCEELEDNEIKKCIFKVWEQTWLSSGLQINITCENDTNIYLFEKRDVNNFDSKEILSKFKDFILEHNKTYLNKIEYNYRLKVFKNNLNTIKLLNKYEQGTGKYGITKFTDLTTDEFSRSHGLRMDLRNENDIPLLPAPIPNITLPIEFDWRQKGAVTQVKNQGSCGSCWAFSTTGNIEGQYAIKYGKLLEFSEQELVDCDKLDEGCNGGLMDNAYRTIEKMGGLETESDYPYDAEDEKCHFDKARVQVQLTGALNISHNETDMAKWLVQNGPISIAINANAMQFYIGGVSHPWKMLCNPKNLDHGVVIVGFGVHKYPLFNKTLPFWTIKNSWGSSWGEQGYYRVYRGDGTCGLNQTPSSATVA